MNLSVPIGMNQDAVLCTICATQRLVHDVVVVPARYLGDGLAIFVFSAAEEAPVLVAESPEVAIFHPSLALPWMSPSCPSPQRFEDGGVDMDKGFLGRCMSVIVCPPSYFRVERRYQPVCCGFFIVLNDLSD